MKTLFLALSLPLFLPLSAQKREDLRSIKSMCGCYEVTFNFAETFNHSPDPTNYTPSKQLNANALEWVTMIEDNPKKISLQHLLVLGDTDIVKHWREDWLFENTRLYDYKGFNDWNFIDLPKAAVKGQWTQEVFSVDDRPRYAGTATWVHVDNRNFWQGQANAPLPRREYTQRKDYNITLRRNSQEIVPQGWIHNQDNDKILCKEDGSKFVVAQEKGYNVYKKVEDSKCAAAQKWWQTHSAFWAKVRRKWEAEYAKNKYLKLQNKVDGKTLFADLSALPLSATQASIDKIIDRFILLKQ